MHRDIAWALVHRPCAELAPCCSPRGGCEGLLEVCLTVEKPWGTFFSDIWDLGVFRANFKLRDVSHGIFIDSLALKRPRGPLRRAGQRCHPGTLARIANLYFFPTHVQDPASLVSCTNLLQLPTGVLLDGAAGKCSGGAAYMCGMGARDAPGSPVIAEGLTQGYPNFLTVFELRTCARWGLSSVQKSLQSDASKWLHPDSFPKQGADLRCSERTTTEVLKNNKQAKPNAEWGWRKGEDVPGGGLPLEETGLWQQRIGFRLEPTATQLPLQPAASPRSPIAPGVWTDLKLV